MGKKRTVTVDGTTATKTKKTIFKWEEAYTELSPKTADALREARIKPEQLAAMADGELLATNGINETNLEEIRAAYPAGMVIDTKQEDVKKDVKKTEVIEEDKKVEGVHPRLHFPRHLHGRSATYKAKNKKTDNKLHSATSAVELLRKVTYSKLKTVELHINTKEANVRGEVTLPNSIGKEVKVAIFNAEVAEAIKAGKMDFDILLATPADMPKIAPLARVLGPKGLMPSPKSNTIVENPEKRAKELQSGATVAYKTEAKAPIIHVVIGSLNQKDEEISGNIKALINGIGVNKLKSATLKSTMSPAVKLDILSL
jgi:large subunit ribosomal protein L1